jgi:hypothetical protein
MLNLCKCGCGELVAQNYKKGHGRRGRRNSLEHNEKISAANKGRKPSTRQYQNLLAMAERRRGTKRGDDERKRISEGCKIHGVGKWMKGRKASEETRERLLRAITGRVVSAETRRKISAANSGSKNGMFGKTHTQGARERIFEAKAHTGNRWTKPEIAIRDLLERLGLYKTGSTGKVGFIPHQWFNTEGFSFNADFADRNNRLIIHVDGLYWHALPGAHERDRRVDRWCCENGWRFVRITDREIKKTPNACLVKVQDLVASA